VAYINSQVFGLFEIIFLVFPIAFQVIEKHGINDLHLLPVIM